LLLTVGLFVVFRNIPGESEGEIRKMEEEGLGPPPRARLPHKKTQRVERRHQTQGTRAPGDIFQ
jgi:hypothetical protein